MGFHNSWASGSDNPQEMVQGVQISMPRAIGEELACFEYSI